MTTADSATNSPCYRDEAIAYLARAALTHLDNLTTDEFALGGDRPARSHLVAILHALDRATLAEQEEYLG
jgi:hypothetical protein